MKRLESARLGSTDQSLGDTIWGQHFLGWRFYLSSSSKITRLGGHLGADSADSQGKLFAAIVKLFPNGFPSFHPHEIQLSGNAMASTLFVPPFPSKDVLIPLASPIILQPGDYGLIFGGADSAINNFPLGATGTGVMPENNSDLPGSSYFKGEPPGWNSPSDLRNLRFFVEVESVVGDQTPPSPPTGLRIS